MKPEEALETGTGLPSKAWLRETLIPAWIDRAVRPGRAGFVEMFDPADPLRDPGPLRTTLVTARLTYVFGHAHLLDPQSGALAAARHGFAFLRDACREGGRGRFLHSVREDGSPVDSRTDLYDLAFVLFAMAWYYRATQDEAALAIADEVIGFIESEMAHPLGGFAEDTLGTLPRRQNPHMHLLEAFHASGSRASIWSMPEPARSASISPMTGNPLSARLASSASPVIISNGPGSCCITGA